MDSGSTLRECSTQLSIGGAKGRCFQTIRVSEGHDTCFQTPTSVKGNGSQASTPTVHPTHLNELSYILRAGPGTSVYLGTALTDYLLTQVPGRKRIFPRSNYGT